MHWQQRRRRKTERCDSVFIPLVPHAEVEHDSREKPTLRSAQEKVHSEESAEVLSEVHEGTDDAPHKNGGQKPHPRGCEVEDEIARILNKM